MTHDQNEMWLKAHDVTFCGPQSTSNQHTIADCCSRSQRFQLHWNVYMYMKLVHWQSRKQQRQRQQIRCMQHQYATWHGGKVKRYPSSWCRPRVRDSFIPLAKTWPILQKNWTCWNMIPLFDDALCSKRERSNKRITNNVHWDWRLTLYLELRGLSHVASHLKRF